MLTIVAILLVALVMAVKSLVAPVMGRDAIGCVPFIGSTRKFSGLAIRRGAVVEFILSILAVFVVVTHPTLGDALPAVPAGELVGGAQLGPPCTAALVWFGDRCFPVIRWYWAPRSTVPPFPHSTDMVTSLVNHCGTPGLVFR